MAPAIVIEGASVYYGLQPALEQVDMTVEDGRFVTIVGPNGGGKTTLFRLILGLVPPAQGRVRVLGRAPGEARTAIGYVPQHSQLDPLFPVRVFDVARMGCVGCKVPGKRLARREVRTRVMEALASVGMADQADRWFSSLSGGQRQRTLIARALAVHPRLLLLDEPTSSVDISAEDKILEVLDRLRGRMTILLVTHYPKVASRFLDQVFCVNRRVHAHPHTDTLDDDLMRHITGMATPAPAATGTET